VGANVDREFGFPTEITLSDEQKEKLKALQTELGPRLKELVEKQMTILTDEQKTQLQMVESELGTLRRDINERRLGLLTDEQKQELRKLQESRNPAPRKRE
jgi:hypothetical protein